MELTFSRSRNKNLSRMTLQSMQESPYRTSNSPFRVKYLKPVASQKTLLSHVKTEPHNFRCNIHEYRTTSAREVA